ncbi:MAG: hypothetical protein MUC60_19355, partial [Oscillatoria sp. Prado101]|nr:hypothetical protein [Oscillatoria sp. Prado101]
TRNKEQRTRKRENPESFSFTFSFFISALLYASEINSIIATNENHKCAGESMHPKYKIQKKS